MSSDSASLRAFQSIQGQVIKKVSQSIDSNGDGKLSKEELTKGATLLGTIGDVMNNSTLENLSDAFTRLSQELERGNRLVDVDGDGKISISGTNNDLDKMIARNNTSLFEVSDVVPSTQSGKTQFDPVNSSVVTMLTRLFDKNKDNQLSQSELTLANTVFGLFAKLMKNNGVLTNWANMFKRLDEEVKAGNRALDANGNGNLEFSEIENALKRNNNQKFEVADLTAPAPTPVAPNQTAAMAGARILEADGGEYFISDSPLFLPGRYNLLEDTNIKLHGTISERTPFGVTRHTLSALDMEIGGKKLHVDADGDVRLDNQDLVLEPGQEKVLQGQDKISRNSEGELIIQTGEYQFVVSSYIYRDGLGARLTVDVKSNGNGVDNGKMPTGLLGETFDADTQKQTNTKLNLTQYLIAETPATAQNLTINQKNTEITTGNANDTLELVTGATGNTVRSNKGNDTVKLTGQHHVGDVAGNQIFTGDGDDQIELTIANGNQIDGGAGNDQITLGKLALGNTVKGGTGQDKLILNYYRDEFEETTQNGNRILKHKATGQILTVNSDIEEIVYKPSTYASEAQTIETYGYGETFYASSKNDTITLKGESAKADHARLNTVYAGDGDDQITLKGNSENARDVFDNTIHAGNGDDAMTLDDAWRNTIHGNQGKDTVLLKHASQNTIDTGDDDDKVIIDWKSNKNTIHLGKGNDEVIVEKTGQYSLNALNNPLSFDDNVIHGGEGQDKVIIDGYREEFDEQIENNTRILVHKVTGHKLKIGMDVEEIQFKTVSDEPQTLNVVRGYQFYATGAGADTVHIGESNKLIQSSGVHTGAGSDTISTAMGINANQSNHYINSGSGDDTLLLSNLDKSTVYAGEGNDSVQLSSNNNFNTVHLESGNDEVVVKSLYNIYDNKIYGGSGHDKVTIKTNEGDVVEKIEQDGAIQVKKDNKILFTLYDVEDVVIEPQS